MGRPRGSNRGADGEAAAARGDRARGRRDHRRRRRRRDRERVARGGVGREVRVGPRDGARELHQRQGGAPGRADLGQGQLQPDDAPARVDEDLGRGEVPHEGEVAPVPGAQLDVGDRRGGVAPEQDHRVLGTDRGEPRNRPGTARRRVVVRVEVPEDTVVGAETGPLIGLREHRGQQQLVVGRRPRAVLDVGHHVGEQVNGRSAVAPGVAEHRRGRVRGSRAGEHGGGAQDGRERRDRAPAWRGCPPALPAVSRRERHGTWLPSWSVSAGPGTSARWSSSCASPPRESGDGTCRGAALPAQSAGFPLSGASRARP